jgi:hypothetical protein
VGAWEARREAFDQGAFGDGVPFKSVKNLTRRYLMSRPVRADPDTGKGTNPIPSRLRGNLERFLATQFGRPWRTVCFMPAAIP